MLARLPGWEHQSGIREYLLARNILVVVVQMLAVEAKEAEEAKEWPIPAAGK